MPAPLLHQPGDATRQALERQYGEVRDDIQSIRMRATGLVTGVGLVFATLALVTPVSTSFRTLAASHREIAIGLGIAVGLLLLALAYLAIGVLWMALRAQQVAFWGQSETHPEEAHSKDSFQIEYLLSLYVTHQDNIARLTNPVSYLRQAQGYFLVLLVVLVALVVVAVGVIATDIGASSQPGKTLRPLPSPTVNAFPARSPFTGPASPTRTP